MISTKTFVPIAALSLALAACGGPEHPKHGPKHPPGPGGVMVAPPSPAIHFTAKDKGGNLLDLQVECGSDTPLKECAQVSQSILDKVSKMQSDSKQQSGSQR